MSNVTVLLHVVLCCSTLAVSVYALYVKRSNEENNNFEALCDLSPHVSCSNVLTSRYSRGFGVLGDVLGDEHPLNVNNSVYGIAFYIAVFLLGLWRSKISLLLVITGEIIGAVNFLYLAYIMIYKLYDFCLVCLTLYLIHFCLLTLHIHQYYKLDKTHKTKIT